MKPAMLTNLTADDQVEAQYSGTNSDSDSSSYELDVIRTPSKTCSNKPLMEILLTGSNEDSGATIPAETVLESNKQGKNTNNTNENTNDTNDNTMHTQNPS